MLNKRKMLLLCSGGATLSYALGADFTAGNNLIVKDNSPVSFSDLFTHSRAGNATMVDSDGLLKWGANNRLTHNKDFTNAAWLKNSGGAGLNPVVTSDYSEGADRIQFDLGGGTSGGDISFVQQSPISASANQHDYAFRIRSTDGLSSYNMEIRDFNGNIREQIVVTSDWQEHTLVNTPSVTTPAMALRLNGAQTPAHSDTADVLVEWSAFHRSDLGGMVLNPDTGTVEVPTTTAAVFKERRNHHVYNSTTGQWENKGLLNESDARTNLIDESNAFDDAYWSKIDTTVETGSGASPDGQTDAAKLTVGSAGTGQIQSSSMSVSSGANICASAFFEYGNHDWVRIQITDGVTHSYTYWINLNTGTVGTSSTSGSGAALSAGVVRYADQIRVYVVGTLSTSTSAIFRIATAASNGSTARVSGGVHYIYGAQLEEATAPSSYIPTSGATATRPADALSIAAADHFDTMPAAVSGFSDGLVTYGDENTAGQVTLFDWRVDANNRITLTIDTDGAETGEITLTMVSGGTSWSIAADYLSPGVNVPYKIAWSATDSEINLTVGGTSATAVAVTSIPDLSAADMTFGGNTVRSKEQIYDRELTASEREALTA